MSKTTDPIDWEALLKLTSNKPDLAKELLGLFAAELPTLRDAINTAFQQGNLDELSDHVHKLHGSCCYTGVPRLKNLTQQLEELVKAKNNKAIKKTLNQINAEIERVLTAIRDQPDGNS